MTARILIGVIWAGRLLGCGRKEAAPAAAPAPTGAEIKELLSRAAGMPGAVYLYAPGEPTFRVAGT